MKKIQAKVWRYIVVVSMGVSQVMSPILVLSDTQEQETMSEASQSSSENNSSGEKRDTSETEAKETDSSSSYTVSSEDGAPTSETVDDGSGTSKENTTSSDFVEDTTETKETNETNETKEAKPTTTSVGEQITDQLLEKGSLLTSNNEEFSQTVETRVLNNTPVKLKLDFEVADKSYPAGSTTIIDLPDHLGFSDNQGTITGIDGSWKVDSSTQKLTVTFNQAITDASFSLELSSYLYSENEPQISITLDDVNQTTYPIDLYESVDAIQYVQEKQAFGLDGTVYYNLDRNLSGTQTLSLEMVETPGATFKKIDTDSLQVYSYDVDISGNIIDGTKEALTEDTDYVITSNEAKNTSVEINQMNRQKAYGVDYNFTLSLTEVSDYTYIYSKNYATTSLGSVSLKQTAAKSRGLSLVAKTSNDEKEVMSKYYSSIVGGSLYNVKGSYALYIHKMPIEMKAGQQIVISTEYGQEMKVDDVRAANAYYESVTVDDYFDFQQADGQLTITAKKESNLMLTGLNVTVPFEQKDININVTSPLIADKTFKVVGDEYVQPISILNAGNAETAWGNYYQNGAYTSDTQVNIEGSKEQPVENLQIFVEHPSYLTMRKVREVNYYYKLDTDYVFEEVDGGTLVTFTTPITKSVQVDIGFNYVPDALLPTEKIPVDEIPVTITADNLEQVDGSVRTGRKQYSESTLQSKENKFLVNARQDTIDDLVVRTVIPENNDVVFKVYDVSNDQEDGIYPQYWYYANKEYKEITKEAEGYPTITFDDETHQYVFDFGQTNRRYVIAFFNANGWQEVNTSTIRGYTSEPLQNNAEVGTTVTVTNTVSNIFNITQSQMTDTKNLTKVTLKTENIDSETKKVINPTITLKTLGNTNGEIDVNSIKVNNVPEDSYEIKETDGVVQLIFNQYTLEDNIEISYHVLSGNAGQISASATIVSESMDTLSEETRTATSDVMNLQFSSGDSDGIIYKTQATFDAFNTEDTPLKIPDVSFTIVNQLTLDIFEAVTDQSGNYQFNDIYTGNYLLYVTKTPEGYVIPEELAHGLSIKLNRTDNLISFGLTPEKDLSAIEAKDSTLYVGDSWQAADNFVSATGKDGSSLAFTDVTVNGTVDTSKEGSYEVTYTNGQATAVATIQVVKNQTTVVAKDSTIYTGDKWEAADNFVSATDKDGKTVALADLDISGDVDTTTAGSYQVTYRNGAAEATATITVLEDQTTVNAKDSTLYVGDNWQAADNFVSATGKDGSSLAFTDVTVNGSVDTSKEGSYEVTYTNGQATAVATIQVVKNQTTVVAKDSTIYTGDKWEAADNFVSATDKDGNEVELADLDISGDVDTTTAGSYQVTYRNGAAEATATITVLADQTTVHAKDSTLYVGETWQAADNFVSATGKDGSSLAFTDVTVNGSVDTSKEGSYEVTYTNGQATAVATIQVVKNQTTVVAKNSTIYTGDKWEAADNFVSATDKDGNEVELADLDISGDVDTTTAGSYQVTYLNGAAEASATITVLADQTTVNAKDSTLYVGDTWQAADNFVSATGKDGSSLAFTDVTVNGTVDTSKEGSYEVTYTNGQATAVATIQVVKNQTTVVAKDSTIYTGDKWEAADNFVSATDKDGNEVELADLDISGDVDTTTAGSYQVTYRNGAAEATATITVLADQTTVKAKDSTLYVGDNWQAADNFVSATGKDGSSLAFTDVTVNGSVDTSKEGSYEVTYTYGQATAVATIQVVKNQTTVVAKDSTIYTGDKWTAADNFVSATDKDGKTVALADLDISGDVDTTTAGSYQVTYRNGAAEATATITVLADQTTVKAKDSTLYVGDTWQAADNFVLATGKDGSSLAFTDVTVNGSVDTSKEGSYEVTYTNGQATAVATIQVVKNQTTVVAKDSTIYTGDKWEAADNFVSATDKDGKTVALADLDISGDVDTTTAGSYQVTYRNGAAEATATITVLADQTTVNAKDSTLYVGDTWQAADNFVSATGKDGSSLAFTDVTVNGSVDTSKEGSYEVTYTNGQATAVATIQVVKNQTTVVAKDSTIYTGDKWEAADNFVSATDKDGNEVELADLDISGDVDTTTAGSYQITYRNGAAEATATITVLADQTTVIVKDTVIYVGDHWTGKDNFVSATDRDGHQIGFDQILLNGSVETNKVGTYQVDYSVVLSDHSETTSFFTRLFGNNEQMAVTATATIKVIEKSNDQSVDEQSNQDDNEQKNQSNISDHSTSEKQVEATAKDKQRLLPKTGTTINQSYSLIGVSCVTIASVLFYRRKRNKGRK